ncbi:MAG: hypothetical protein GC206_08425 [Alphaproteobacteria bacterium]|nr:hypothetical protein [Alphaproteobacteria bacterium]
MKLLIDSCTPASVTGRLRADGHDVATVAERGLDPGDTAILETAATEGRTIVTIDADFGALVFRDQARHAGVLRLRQATPAVMAERASALIAAHDGELSDGAFVTDDGGSARVTPRPK